MTNTIEQNFTLLSEEELTNIAGAGCNWKEAGAWTIGGAIAGAGGGPAGAALGAAGGYLGYSATCWW